MYKNGNNWSGYTSSDTKQNWDSIVGNDLDVSERTNGPQTNEEQKLLNIIKGLE